MRGSPILQLILMALALSLSGIPIWILTHHQPSEKKPSTPLIAATSGDWLDVEITTSTPGVVKISQLGKVLLESSPSQTITKGKIYALQNAELVTSAHWENSKNNNAVRIVLSKEGTVMSDTTFWGADSVEDTLP